MRGARGSRVAAFVSICLLIAGCAGNPPEGPSAPPRVPTPVADEGTTSTAQPTVAGAQASTTPAAQMEAGEESEMAPPPAPAAPARRAPGDPLAGLDGLGAIGHGAGGGGYGRGAGSIGVAGAVANVMPMGSAGGPMLGDPNAEPVDREGYAAVDPNGFIAVGDQPLSTFSADVDTASYANVRRFLRDGQLPPSAAVRIEEMINYFRYDDPAPAAGEPFAVRTELGACPWAPEHQLLRIGLRTPAIQSADTPARNLVFLLDVSGSMSDPDKLPLLRQGMGLLVDQLRPQDRVAIVVYAGASGMVLPSTPGSDRATILAALERLEAGGSTNGGAGIELAYQVAQQHFVRGGINRVILATDGDFNVGVSSQGELARLIEQKRRSGVFLTVLGFGTGNLQDATMEMLADRGNGNYAYIDSIAEARRVLVREAGATLVTVAKDVKLQVEWNPAHVASYRLVGYENRLLRAQDFNDDRRDAGEMGAGHHVTVLYELIPPGADSAVGAPRVDPLRYQSGSGPTGEHRSELALVRVRFKQPDQDQSRLREFPVATAVAAGASRDFRFATAVAGFGMWLRGDEGFPASVMPALRQAAVEASGPDADAARVELVHLMDTALGLRN